METTTSLNGLFKQVYADNLLSLIPTCDILLRNDRIKFVQKDGREGLYYNQPVVVSLPSGATWGVGNPVTLTNAIASQLQNAQLAGSGITHRDLLSYDAAAKAGNGGKQSFAEAAGLVIRNLTEALGKFLELDLLYGAGAITSGVSLASSTSVASSSSNAAITISYSTWSPAMFSGFENAQIVAYQAGVQVIGSGSGIFTIVSVNVVPASSSVGGVITVSGNASDISALIAATGSTSIDLYWNTSYGNNMTGLKGILTNTGSLFGINASTYSLWQSNTFDCLNTNFTFSKLQQAVSLGVNRGLSDDAIVLVSPTTFADLVNEQAGARRYDSSYKPKELENGTEELMFYGPNGKLEVVPHLYLHQGEAMIIPTKETLKVGPIDGITSTLPGMPGEFFVQSQTYAAWEMRLYSNMAVLIEKPAHGVFVKNINN
jgi:hypothetical protein